MTTKDKLRNYISPMPGRKWVDSASVIVLGVFFGLWIALATSPVAAGVQISILLGLVFPAVLAFVWTRDRLGLSFTGLREDLALLAVAACLLSVPLKKYLTKLAI
ncbi:hypothetical protein GGI1_02370 [Acidithiobacillus sp. GGI-221]|nr:hypothetical protein GGI1_02370 [Acidithiobacillus sp. GGI-221]